MTRGEANGGLADSLLFLFFKESSMKINKMLVVGLLVLGFGAVSQIEAVARVTLMNETGMPGFVAVRYAGNMVPGLRFEEKKNITANGSVVMEVESGRQMLFGGVLGGRTSIDIVTAIPAVLRDGDELTVAIRLNPNNRNQAGLFLVDGQ